MNINLQKKGLSAITTIVVVCIVLIFLGIFLLIREKPDTEKVPIPLNEEEVVWKEYKSKDYQFELSYPAHWNVKENFDGVAPTIVFSPQRIGDDISQFDNVNQVVIYPEGFPYEGLRGETEESDLNIQSGDESLDFVLEDGRSWATYSSFKNIPKSWKPYGFIWASVELLDLEYGCIDGRGNIIDIDNCDPYSGNTFTRSGIFKSDIRNIEEKIIESFKFTK